MSDLDRLLGALTPEEQRALLARLDGGSALDDDPPPRRLGRTRAPLSFAQLGLWFLHQLSPHSAAYHVAFAITVPTAADPAAWRAALDGVVRRHEALRTRFEPTDGEPAQVVEPAVEVPLDIVDGTGLSTADRTRLVETHTRRPFDLAEAPLLRALLLTDDDEHTLVLTTHHIVFDGASLAVLLHELATVHEAVTGGRTTRLPELPLQYADYATWQRERLTAESLQRHLDHWRQRLDGMSVLELPTDRPRPPARRHRGRTHCLPLPAPLVHRLREVARDHGATSFMALLATVQMLLATHTGDLDVTVAVPLADRGRPEWEPLIGLLVDTVPMRLVPAAPDPTFAQLVRSAKATTLDALRRQSVPFDQLVRELRPDRSLSHDPISPVFLTVAPAVDADIPPGWRVDPVELGVARADLTFAFEEGEDRITVALEYDSDLFEPATIERLGERLVLLLDHATADPDRRVSELPVMADAEQRQLLAWGAGPVTAFPRDRLVHELVSEQAARTPGAVAVTAGDDTLTYAELIARADRLASRLRRLGVGPDVAVGCHAERSADVVVGLLAVLTAGGAYVPLDPSHPVDRLRFMLADSDARVLLTSGGRGVPGWTGPELDLAAPDEHATADPAATPPEVRSEHLAYLMYTSGSTGRPKAVAVSHRAVVRLVRDTDYVRIGPDDRIAHVGNLSFDATTFEIWGALCNGGRVVVVPRDALLDPPVLAAELRRHGVTAMFLTPQLFGRTVHAVPDAFAGVRDLLVGGDAVDPGPVRAALRATPAVRLLNAYGPTESTTFATIFAVDPPSPDATTVPIGRPIANTRAYVLDANLRMRPIGVPGELCLGGDGLARGYHQRPRLTAERFVPDPHATRPGDRLYRTGDVARWLPDGTLEHLGRRDGQVKVRGQRVELGEIESRLTAHPDVTAAAVIVDDAGGDRRLAAYVVPAGAGAPTRRDLATWVSTTLPAHMTPASFTVVDGLPLTPNGKLDRAALARMPAARDAPDTEDTDDTDVIAPRDDVERAVAAVWSELLGVPRIDVRDNFFTMGGHSLLATQVVGRLRALFATADRLSVRTLFEAPTVEGLAAAVVESMMAGLDAERLDHLLTLHAAEPEEPPL